MGQGEVSVTAAKVQILPARREDVLMGGSVFLPAAVGPQVY